MVSKLHYFRSKREFSRWVKSLGLPESVADERWEGRGWYYHRGRGYIVRYSSARDRARGGRVGRGSWRHTHDISKLVGRLRHHVKRVARALAKKKASKLRRRGHRKKEAVEVAAKHTISVGVRRARSLTNASPAVKKIAQYLWSEIPRQYKEGRNRVWTYIAVVSLAKVINKYCSAKGVDWKAVDWSQEIDWRQGYRHAKQYVKDILGVGKYEDIRESDIGRIEREWNQLRRDLKLPETVDPWELKALFS